MRSRCSVRPRSWLARLSQPDRLEGQGLQAVLQHPLRGCLPGAGAGSPGRTGSAVHPAQAGGRNAGAARRTFICIASGPSLTIDDCQRVGRWKDQATETDQRLVIAVNESWRRAGFADYLYAADGKWWRHRSRDGRITIDAVRADFRGDLWTCDLGASRDFGLNRVNPRNAAGLVTTPGEVGTGGQNGGMQAVGLAWHLGATRIVLLGYDMTGAGHWHGPHVDKLGDPSPGLMQRWAAAAAPIARDLVARGVEIFNCSRVTAAQGWPRATLEDVLALHLPDPIAA